MAPAADQSTSQPPMPFSQPHQMVVEADVNVLAGRQFELPLTGGGKYWNQVDNDMPITLRNVMGAEEYAEQVEEINEVLRETSKPYSSFINTFRSVYIIVVIVLIVLFIGAFIGSFFTMGATIVALFIIWFPAVIVMFVGVIVGRQTILKRKNAGDEASKARLADINQKWAPRGIAWRQKEGETVFANLTSGRRRMAWVSIRPLIIVIELAPNAATLYQTMGPFPPTQTETVIDLHTAEANSLLEHGAGEEMHFAGTQEPQEPSPQYTPPQAYAEPQPFSAQQASQMYAPHHQQPQPMPTYTPSTSAGYSSTVV